MITRDAWAYMADANVSSIFEATRRPGLFNRLANEMADPGDLTSNSVSVKMPIIRGTWSYGQGARRSLRARRLVLRTD